MGNKLIVQIKNIYGVQRVYPVCEKSKSFSRIAGLKTLQQSTIDEIKKLGYKIETRGEKL
jgi:copper chaperone CopZ